MKNMAPLPYVSTAFAAVKSGVSFSERCITSTGDGAKGTDLRHVCVNSVRGIIVVIRVSGNNDISVVNPVVAACPRLCRKCGQHHGQGQHQYQSKGDDFLFYPCYLLIHFCIPPCMANRVDGQTNSLFIGGSSCICDFCFLQHFLCGFIVPYFQYFVNYFVSYLQSLHFPL